MHFRPPGVLVKSDNKMKVGKIFMLPNPPGFFSKWPENVPI